MKKLKITHTAAFDLTKCPYCGSKNVTYEYVGCLCHRTNGSQPTCWTAPVCKACRKANRYVSNWGNSDGGAWCNPADCIK